MSEIKGQLLGMLLVLMLFAAVAGVMFVIFQNTTGAIGDKVDEIISLSTSFSS